MRKFQSLLKLPCSNTNSWKKIDKTSLAMNKLGNQMVLDWTIESALNAKRVSNVIVTTPDEEIIEYIKNKYKKG